MNRSRRRALAVASVITDTLALLAWTGAFLAGAVPAVTWAVTAAVLAAGIAGGTYYLRTSGSRP